MELKRGYVITLLLGIITFILALIIHSVFGLISTVIFMVLVLMHPKACLWIMVVFEPMRPMLTAIEPSLKIFGDLLILGMLLRVIWNKYRHQTLKDLFRLNIFEWALIAFVVLGSIAALLTGVTLAAIILQIRAFILMYLLYYCLKRLDGIDEKDMRVFLWLSFATAIVVCGQGIIEKLSDRALLIPEDWKNQEISATNRFRIYGMPGNPNSLALYLGVMYILVLYLRSFYQGGLRWLLNIGLVVISGVFILTYSRGSMIAYGVTLLTFILLTRNLRPLVPIIITVVCSFLLIYLPVNAMPHDQGSTTDHGTAKKRMEETFNKDTLNKSWNGGRLYVVKEGFKVFQDHPIIGTGFGTYGDSAATAYGSPIYDDYNINPNLYSDNQYIQIIVETGTLGVILFAVYLLGLLIKLWKKRKTIHNVSIIVLSLLLGAYVSGLYYNIWEVKAYTFFFFSMLGYVAFLCQKEIHHEDTTFNRR